MRGAGEKMKGKEFKMDEEMKRPETGGGMAEVQNRNWYEVTIRKADNGFIVHVGCKTFVFLSWVDAQIAITEYWDNPREAERKYCRKS